MNTEPSVNPWRAFQALLPGGNAPQLVGQARIELCQVVKLVHARQAGEALGGIIDERQCSVVASGDEWNRHVSDDGVEVACLEVAFGASILESSPSKT